MRWTPQAADDLEAIATFIAHDSPHYAHLFVVDVLAAAEDLASFPNAGRIVPETGDLTIREVILGNYRIIYRVKPELVEVVTVYHAARLLVQCCGTDECGARRKSAGNNRLADC